MPRMTHIELCNDKLDSKKNFRQPVKKETLEITCYIIVRNSDDSLENESIETIIKK